MSCSTIFIVWLHFVPMKRTVYAGSVVLMTLPALLRDSLTRETQLDVQPCLYYFKLTRKPWSVPYYYRLWAWRFSKECHTINYLQDATRTWKAIILITNWNYSIIIP